MQFIYVNFYLLNLILKFKTHQVKTIKLILALLLILLLTDCNSKNGIQNQFKQGAQNIETHYISDKTLAVFQVSLDKNAGQWELSGETNHLIAHQKIIGFSDSLLGKDAYTNYFSALPDSALGDSTYGIINVSNPFPGIHGKLLWVDSNGQFLFEIAHNGQYGLVFPA